MLGPLANMLGPLGAARGVVGDAVYTNASPASISPAEGSELLVNGDFSAWTADDPDGWTIVGEVGADPEVTQRAPNTGHAGAGSGACNLYSSATSQQPQVEQAALTINSFTRVAVQLTNRVSGSMRPVMGTQVLQSVTTPSTYIYAVRPDGSTFNVRQNGASGDITIDNCSAKLLSGTLVSEHTHSTPLSDNQCEFTVPIRNSAGVYQRHSASGDYVLAYLDRQTGRAYLLKVVSGTTVEVASAAIAYAAGNVLKLKHHQADGWQVFYDTPANIDTAAALITNELITDANLDACNEDGLFSTDSGITFANYQWSPNA